MSDNGFDKYIKNEVKVLAEYNMNVLKNKIKLKKEKLLDKISTSK